MAEQGKRLTCPICKDSVWMSAEELAVGVVQCANHWVGVEMVDLAALMEILGRGAVCEDTDGSEEIHQEAESRGKTAVLVQGIWEEVSFS